MKTCNRCDFSGDEATNFAQKGGGAHRPECKRCTGAAQKVYYARNKKSVTKYQRQYRKQNAKKLQEYEKARDRSNRRAQHRAYYARNREDRKAAARARYAANRAVALFRAKHQRARRRSALGVCSNEQLKARIAFYGGKCAYCGGPFEHVDHVIALARGGTNWPANLRPACARCNGSKHARPLQEWLATRRS